MWDPYDLNNDSERDLYDAFLADELFGDEDNCDDTIDEDDQYWDGDEY